VDDVIIVGGGHVGLYLAWRLARRGYKIALLDQKKNIGEHIVCTGIIGTEAFSRFDLPHDTIVGAIQRVRFFSPLNHYFDYDPPGLLAQVVDRTRFNRTFAERATRHGARIVTSCRVDGVRVKKDGVVVKASVSNAGERLFEAKILVLATGVNYKLFKGLGVQGPVGFLGGAQIEIPYPPEERISVYVGREVAPGSFAWVVPLPAGRARVGLLAEKTPAAPYLKRLLDRIHPGWRDDIREETIDIRPIVQGTLERSYGERFLIVGEAAGQIKTTTGGGIYYGLLGAEIAAETLEEAFRRSKFAANVLSPYERRWKKEIGEELRFGHYCRQLFSKFSDEQIEELFDRLSQDQILNIAEREAAFDWHKNLLLSVLNLPKVRRLIQNPF
jgi:geranylgeranyl reductase family protein